MLHEGPNVVGRGENVQIRVDSSWASREHARIVVDAGCVTLEDLGSKNGTFLNGREVKEPEVLRHGDAIRIGRTDSDFRFVAVGRATLTEPES
jgi:pSer/pThr/pTyr-binding forkhead associated (FHA) protein